MKIRVFVLLALWLVGLILLPEERIFAADDPVEVRECSFDSVETRWLPQG